MAPDTDLFSLAVWLHGEARKAYSLAGCAAEPYGAAATLDSAAKLELASQVVKEMADQQRKQRGAAEYENLSKRA